MKHAIKYTLLLLMLGALLLGGCSRKKIIPDEELSKIAREMFLTNAYVSLNKTSVDSIDMYTPILERYGYTQDDFFNTLANFQKRKSARLSDVINATITDLDNLTKGYQKRVRDLKYIDSLAKATYQKEFFVLGEVKVDRMKDTARLRLSFPIVDKGEYAVEYSYVVDTLDKNLRLQSEHATYDENGKRLSLMRNNLASGGTKKHYQTTIVPKKGATRYELVLADYTRREEEPHISFSSLRIIYYPAVEEALEQLDYDRRIRPAIHFDEQIRFREFPFTKTPMLPTDTVWVHLDTVELAAADRHLLEADSLEEVGSKAQKELKKLKAKSQEWRRKNGTQIDSLEHQITLLDSLRGEHIRKAEELETNVFGQPREREKDDDNKE